MRFTFFNPVKVGVRVEFGRLESEYPPMFLPKTYRELSFLNTYENSLVI